MSETSNEAIGDGNDAEWYKDAIIYQVHVRSFADSNDDGIGDFAGLTQKLDYLKDLGVTAIWVMPFYPSPLLDDGYDIAEYTEVNPSYGHLRDVRTFIREAHRRGLRVITELVCNHTSDQHPWFQRARRSRPGSAARDFYVWSDNDNRYKDARIIFKDFESSNWSWDAEAGAYYWHRFYRHQPDLNFENPRVHEAIRRVLDFWLEMGVDGLRLDAIPYLYEEEGTSCENLPQGFEYLRQLRKYIDDHYANRMLLAEANQWPEDAVAYFGDGDICQMAFHFPVMPRLFMAIHQEDRFPIVDIVRQTPAIPDNCQWAVFLRNHDELTLEMVTDEERDYMYRVYAADQRMRINLGIRRRLAPLLGNHRRRIELMNALLFALPGTPVLYYGDEIGMGDNVYLGDRNGVRTPMQWSGDRNAGFSRANPQRLFMPVIIDPEYHYETVNVEAQQQNQHSLLWWTKRLIALRRRYKAFGRGTMEFLHPDNRKILCFIRRLDEERILVVANLSRFAQGVSLDLTEFQGMVPVEMFGRVEMPPVTDQPYFLTLGPHSFFWFSLEPQKVPVGRAFGEDTPVHVLNGGWEELFDLARSNALVAELPEYVAGQRWFAGKGRRVRSMNIEEVIPVRNDAQMIYLTLVNVQYSEGTGETYMLPLTYASGEAAFQRIRSAPQSVVIRLRSKRSEEEAILFDAMYDEGFAGVCLRAIERRQHMKTDGGELVGSRTNAFREIGIDRNAKVETLRADHTNTSINYGDRMLLKLFRRLEPGMNPDLEIGRYLTTSGFKHSPRVAGAVEYRRGNQEPITLGVLNEFIVKESDAWTFTLDSLRDFLDRTMALNDEIAPPSPTASTFMRLSEETPPPFAIEAIGHYLESARLLGIRTAEMHQSLGSGTGNSAFAPEPYTPHYQRGLYQSLRNMTTNNFALLNRHVRASEAPLPEAQQAAALEEQVLAHFRRITGKPMHSSRIRAHGDYHLGQVLYTGNDFVITDFEGEPARTITERRIRRSPLRDVAGMLRSFSYAVHTALQELRASGIEGAPEERVRQWGRFWEAWVSSTFLRAYLEESRKSKLLVADWAEIELLLDVFMLEKVVYEIAYELNNRPDWLIVPLSGLLEIVKTES